MNEFDEFVEKLISYGEDRVGRMLIQGLFAGRRERWAKEWIASLEAARINNRADDDRALRNRQMRLSEAQKKIAIVAIAVVVFVPIAIATIQIVGQKHP